MFVRLGRRCLEIADRVTHADRNITYVIL
jgi:hypothetical protein